MLRNSSGIVAISANLLLGTIWHLFILAICVYMPADTFDYTKPMYREKKWENGGKWYAKHLKINKWKDILPQYVGRDGFSKAHLQSTSEEYLNRFIMETCRGEWNHKVSCFYSVITLAISPPVYGIFFAVVAVVGNLLFASIQRYNRIRLLRLKTKISSRREK